MSEVFPTTVVGSYPKPKYLNKAFTRYYKKRLTASELKRICEKAIYQVVAEEERAGVDIISDGEMRRSEMVEFFAERISGFKFYGLVRVWGNNYYRKPSVVKKLEYKKPMLVEEYEFLKKITKKRIKTPITGPYTLADWSFNEFYKKKEELIFDLAEIIHKELKELEKVGANFIQIDEPALSTHPEEIEIAKEAVRKVVKGVKAKIGMHLCYGEYEKIYPALLEFDVDQIDLEFANREFDIKWLKEYEFTKELGFGCIDVHNPKVESVEEVVKGIKEGLKIVPPEKLYVKPDCGLKLLPRKIAYKKLCVMVQAAKRLREEYSI